MCDAAFLKPPVSDWSSGIQWLQLLFFLFSLPFIQIIFVSFKFERKKKVRKSLLFEKKNIKIKEERLRCRQRWTMTLIWRGFNELLHAKDLFTEMDETNAVLRPLTRPFLHSFFFHSFFS